MTSMPSRPTTTCHCLFSVYPPNGQSVSSSSLSPTNSFHKFCEKTYKITFFPRKTKPNQWFSDLRTLTGHLRTMRPTLPDHFLSSNAIFSSPILDGTRLCPPFGAGEKRSGEPEGDRVGRLRGRACEVVEPVCCAGRS